MSDLSCKWLLCNFRLIMCEVSYTLKEAFDKICPETDSVMFAKEVQRSGKRIFVTCTKVDGQKLLKFSK